MRLLLSIPRRKRIVAVTITILDRPVLSVNHDLNPFPLRLLAGLLKGFGLCVTHAAGTLGLLLPGRPAIFVRYDMDVSIELGRVTYFASAWVALGALSTWFGTVGRLGRLPPDRTAQHG